MVAGPDLDRIPPMQSNLTDTDYAVLSLALEAGPTARWVSGCRLGTLGRLALGFVNLLTCLGQSIMTDGDGSVSCDGQRGGSEVRFRWRRPFDIQGMGRRHHLQCHKLPRRDLGTQTTTSKLQLNER